MKELDRLLGRYATQRQASGWIEIEDLTIHIVLGYKTFKGVNVETAQIINVFSDNRGNGQFTKFLRLFEYWACLNFACVAVCDIMNGRLLQFLKNERHYTIDDKTTRLPCAFKPIRNKLHV